MASVRDEIKLAKAERGRVGGGSSMDAERAASSRITRATTKPRARQQSLDKLARRPADLKPAMPAGVVKMTPLKPRRSSGLGGPGGIAAGLLHVAENAGHAVVASTLDHPLAAAEKTAGFLGDTVKGLATVAGGVPVYTARYYIGAATGHQTQETPGAIVGRMVHTTAKSLSDKYGPSYRHEHGAYGKLRKQVDEEGPAATALDLTTLAAPASIAVGAGARAATAARVARGAEAGTLGRIVAKTTARPALKVDPLKPGRAQKPRRSAAGATVAYGHDTARRVVQRVHVARSVKTGKPLSARRATLKPGEVAPISETAANRTVRYAVARDVGHGQARSAIQTADHITKPHGDTVRANFMTVPKELHHVVIAGAKYGIRDSAGAKRILQIREHEIMANRQLAKDGHLGPKAKTLADKRQAAGDEGELARIHELLADPSVFDQPAVRDAIGREAERPGIIGKAQGLTDERAAAGRTELMGRTLGVETKAAEHSRKLSGQAEVIGHGKIAVKDAQRKLAKTQASAQRVVAHATADLAKAKGRAEVLSRNVGGGGKAGGLGIRHATDELARTQAKAAEGVSAAKAALDGARGSLKDMRAPIKRETETAVEYAARVDAHAAGMGLAKPAFVPSKREAAAVRVSGPKGSEANPLARKRSGVLHDLGFEATTPEDIARTLGGELRKGTSMGAQSDVLAAHGQRFANEHDMNAHIAEHGIDPESVAAIKPGVARRDIATQRTGKGGQPSAGSDMGHFVKTDDVFMLPKAAHDELEKLGIQASKPAEIAQKIAGYSQAAILALRPSWFQFQRVNDAVSLTLSGAAPHMHALAEMRAGLSPAARQELKVWSGGSVSSSLLKPDAIREVGRLQAMLDANPFYQKVFQSDNPASRMLGFVAENPATTLLRADQAITGQARELQMLYTLRSVAHKMDPDVSIIQRAFAPIGGAMKTGDTALLEKLLTSPAYKAQLEDAAVRLHKVAGDWHTYTAREQRVKHIAAFYGFLRYATKMALFTLPIDHPHVAMLIAQLGQMGAKDSKSIIGPDIPWGLGTLYHTDGTVAADMTKANPLLGPLFSITKPEQVVGLATPVVGLLLNYLTSQNLAQQDGSEGYHKGYTVDGNADNRNAPIGGFTGTPRLRILARGVLNMLGPVSEWDRYDKRAQSDDSLPWDRKYLESSKPATRAKLAQQNADATKADGGKGLLHNQLPLVFPGSGKNVKKQGETIGAAKDKAAYAAELAAVKRKAALNTPLGRAKLDIATAKAERDAARQSGSVQQQIELAKREIALAKAERP